MMTWTAPTKVNRNIDELTSWRIHDLPLIRILPMYELYRLNFYSLSDAREKERRSLCPVVGRTNNLISCLFDV